MSRNVHIGPPPSPGPVIQGPISSAAPASAAAGSSQPSSQASSGSSQGSASSSGSGKPPRERGPAWNGPKPPKPILTDWFWIKPYNVDYKPEELLQTYSPVEEGYVFGFWDSINLNIKKVVDKCNEIWDSGPTSFDYAAYLQKLHNYNVELVHRPNHKLWKLINEFEPGKRRGKNRRRRRGKRYLNVRPVVPGAAGAATVPKIAGLQVHPKGGYVLGPNYIKNEPVVAQK